MKKTLLRNIRTIYQVGETIPDHISGSEMKNVPTLNNAFIVLEEGIITDYGKMSSLSQHCVWEEYEVVNADGCFVLPSFCDAHTHAVFARSREEEFIDRINGLTYEEIALKGGGILNSARRLHEKSEDALFEEAKERILRLIQLGTGAIEIKSGYGLSVEGELKMLRVINRLKKTLPIPVKATFLGAHAFPAEFKENREGYLGLLLEEILPQVASEQLADYIDVFCERNYFSVKEMERILKAGARYGLRPKVHVNQFSVMGAIEKAVELNALSVDHLEELSDEDIYSLKGSTCMPTLLPGCSHFLGIPFGQARRLMDAGLAVALASDFNPGSSPSGNLMQVWSLACVKMKMTPEEALNALTINAAYAMGLAGTHGKISKGAKTPLILTKPIPSLAYIPYAFGENHIQQIIF